jgi:imidazolonepropionase-like amidohydrolase
VKAAFLLMPARVFDSENGQTRADWAVLVVSNSITAVGPAGQIQGQAPANSVKLELPGMTLLPGLMDLHSHIFLHPYNEALWNDQVLKEPVAYRSV